MANVNSNQLINLLFILKFGFLASPTQDECTIKDSAKKSVRFPKGGRTIRKQKVHAPLILYG